MGEGNEGGIPGPAGVGATKPVEPGSEGQAGPIGGDFQSYMQKGSGATPSPLAKGGEPSPFDLALGRQGQGGGHPTHESLLGQMGSTSSVLGDLQSQLINKDLKLKPSQKYLLTSKLTSANQDIRSAATRLGVQAPPPPDLAQLSRQNPVDKFLALLSDSQEQVAAAQTKIHTLAANGQSMNPADLLLVQVKMAQAQQKLEFASIVMSTVSTDMKTVFNIQL